MTMWMCDNGTARSSQFAYALISANNGLCSGVLVCVCVMQTDELG